MTRVGIISDTHGCFDDKLIDFLKDVDLILHSGDIGNVETADKIAAFKTMVAVYGNIDDSVIRRACPKDKLLKIEDVTIFMTHIGGYPGRYDTAAKQVIDKMQPKLFISGHSHILKVMPDKKRNMLHINPGAAGIHGFHNVRTAVRLIIDGDTMRDLEVGEWERRTI